MTPRPKSSASRVAALRARREKAGWVELTLWAHHTDKERIEKYAKRLRARAEATWGKP